MIEVAVVVFLIGFLTLIALPQFQEALTRSKVTRARIDMRSLSTAIEWYRLDASEYPLAALGDLQLEDPLKQLTTPIIYVAGIPLGPFGEARFDFSPSVKQHGYNYKDKRTTSIGMPGETYGHIWRALPQVEYFIHSCGPNEVWDVMPYREYSPTNGSRSVGDITIFGPI